MVIDLDLRVENLYGTQHIQLIAYVSNQIIAVLAVSSVEIDRYYLILT